MGTVIGRSHAQMVGISLALRCVLHLLHTRVVVPAIKCWADPPRWPSLRLLLNAKRHGLAVEPRIAPKGAITKSALLAGSRSEMAIADMMDQTFRSAHRCSPLATCRLLKSRSWQRIATCSGDVESPVNRTSGVSAQRDGRTNQACVWLR